MTDRDALIAAIIEHPEEDTPRLMFADWLKENNEADRGEFVRLQVLASQAEPHSLQARQYEESSQNLLVTNIGYWTQHLVDRVVSWRFARGFAEHLSVNAATFSREAAKIFAVEPVRSLHITRFAFTTAPVPLDAIFALPQMSRIRSLDLRQMVQHADYFESLDRAPHFQQLTHLGLRNTPVPVNWLRALVTGTAFPALASLDLAEDAHLPRVLSEALPAAAHRRFTRLDFSHIAFKSDQLKRALESRCLREIEDLRMCWLQAAGEGPLTFLNLGWVIPWDRLRVLDLAGQGIRDEGMHEIVTGACHREDQSPLRWLGLANNRLTHDGIRVLVNASERKLQLFHLDVRDNGLPKSQLTALKERFPEAVILS